tara:strand:- start:21 stop:1421 length:1401 start_codon:yes stop_codon:yes gene_type:complete
MPKPVKFTRGNKFQEQEGDYDPEQWRRRDPNVSELASDSDRSRIPGQGGFSPHGPVGDLDAVPAESSQRKALLGLEQELELIKKSAANLDVSLVDQPMTVSKSPQPIKSSGIPAVDKIREQTAQIDFDYETKSALRSGGGTNLTTNPEFFKEDSTPKTYREFYEEKISEKISQIEVEKALMGETYEQQALKESTSRGYANIGEALDEVDLELATGDVSDIKSTAKNAPSIANPEQVHTNIGFRGEIHSITQGPEGPVRNPINRPPQVTRADTAETPLKPGERGYTGLEPEGYSPMNPTTPRTGETMQDAKRRVAAEARKAASAKKKGFVPPAGMNDDITDAQEKARNFDSLDNYPDKDIGGASTSPVTTIPKNPSGTPTAKELPTTDVGGVDVNDINYQNALKKALASGLDAVTSAAIATKSFQAAKGVIKAIGKRSPVLMPVMELYGPVKEAWEKRKDKPEQKHW